MEPGKSMQTKREYLPALDGLRGYGFIAVFLGHYFAPLLIANRSNPAVLPIYVLGQVVWVAIPGFFVLSGYLIGGILFHTRNREGFFRVFYARRIMRVFPVYYISLIAVACFDIARGVPLHFNFWSHFLYIHNLLPGYTGAMSSPPWNQVIHFWSLAIEEQFYLTWPIIVWLARDRKTLLRICMGLIAACWLVRFLSPWIHLSPVRSYFATPTRADAILMGVALALITDHAIYKRIQPFAKYVVFLGSALVVILASTHLSHPNNYVRVMAEIPIANLTATALLMMLLDRSSAVTRVCSIGWVRFVGGISYGLYVIHFTFQSWFLGTFEPWLEHYTPTVWASVLTAVCALTLTIALALMSFYLIERPAMILSHRLKYGPAREPQPAAPITASAAPAPFLLRGSPAQNRFAGSLYLVQARNARRVRR